MFVFLYWGACRPQTPLLFSRFGRRATLGIYSCVYNYDHRCACLSILGSVPHPRPPCFVFGSVGERENVYNHICHIDNHRYVCFSILGSVPPPGPRCFFFGSVGGRDKVYNHIFHIDNHRYACLSILGGVPPPRPPCFFLGSVGGRE